jgi:riboflavin kinase/FMN adenylyltransferase
MIHVHSLDDLQLNKSWATIGMFDGLHRGHRAIIEPMVLRAKVVDCPVVVVTFHPSPAVVLRGNGDVRYLTLTEERTELLGNLGVQAVVTLEFTHDLAHKTAEEFIRWMVDRLGLARLWVGYDFALGRNRGGTLPVLQELGKRFGYQMEVVAPVEINGMAVSSSRIRALLAEGHIRQVTNLLGRWYSLHGTVVHGDGRGRRLGIPTANLQVSAEKLLPPNGVYAVWAWVGTRCYPAVANIGVRPTFTHQQTARRVEAHVLDFDVDLYGQAMRLDFAEFIRPELRFDGPGALVAQVQQDIRKSRNILVMMDLESGG